MKTTAFIVSSLIFAMTSSCGGTNPMQVFANPNSTPVLNLPFASNVLANVYQYNSNTGQMKLQVASASQTTAQILVPGAGVVSNVAAGSNGGISVTIYHNSHISSVLDGLTNNQLRVGDVVVQNQVLGYFLNGSGLNYIYMSVLLDGSAVCPYSYFSTDTRQFISSGTFGGNVNLCPN